MKRSIRNGWTSIAEYFLLVIRGYEGANRQHADQISVSPEDNRAPISLGTSSLQFTMRVHGRGCRCIST